MTACYITETLKLDHCWICGNKSSLEEHHIIPSAYGGRNGPTITLCAICHSAIHSAAQKKGITTNTGSEDLCLFCDRWCSAGSTSRIMYLIALIRKSRYITKNDANKTVKVSYTLDAQTARMLRYTAQQLGVTQQVAIGVAIKSLHDRLFGTVATR